MECISPLQKGAVSPSTLAMRTVILSSEILSSQNEPSYIPYANCLLKSSAKSFSRSSFKKYHPSIDAISLLKLPYSPYSLEETRQLELSASVLVPDDFCF
jgi:hypothetical protein